MLVVVPARLQWCLSRQNAHGKVVTQLFGGDSGGCSKSSSVCSMTWNGSQIHHHQSSRQSSCTMANHWQSFGRDLASVLPTLSMLLYATFQHVEKGKASLLPSPHFGTIPSVTRSGYVTSRSEASMEVTSSVLMDTVPSGSCITRKASALT